MKNEAYTTFKTGFGMEIFSKFDYDFQKFILKRNQDLVLITLKGGLQAKCVTMAQTTCLVQPFINLKKR